MRRLLAIPLALLVLLVGAIWWSGGTAEQRADFTFINRGDIITLDPNQMSYLQDIRIGYAIWEGLYSYNSDTLVPVPGCASGHELSADRRTYRFQIRPETRWSSGDDVTAEDFVFAWRRMLESPGEYTYLLFYIRGAAAYSQAIADGRPADFATVGIRTPDSKTLEVELNEPVPFFLDLVAFPPFFPLHERSMASFRRIEAGRVSYDQRFTRPPYIVGNGPYRLVQWQFKRRLRMEANPHYWDRANVRSRTIEMVVVEDMLTQFLRYESGTVDWVSQVSTEIAPALLAGGRSDLHVFPAFGTQFLTINCQPRLNNGTPNPLADVRVRQALAMSIDKRQIVQNITRMGEPPATTYIPPTAFADWRSPAGLEYDPRRARELLAEAGYPGGAGFPMITYIVRSDSPTDRDTAQNLVSQWKQVLGISMVLVEFERKIYRQHINARDYQIGPANWIGDYGDPSTFTDKYRENSENNDAVWKNARYNELVQLAAAEANSANRLRLLEQAEGILLQEAPIIPLYHLTNQYLYRNNVKGISLNPRTITMFKSVFVER